ncbi:unnamed protein product [Chrysoparadoxa australica]
MCSLKVAIIGGGPGGLAALKVCLEASESRTKLVPTLFEAACTLGGLWTGPGGGAEARNIVWPSLTTNFSKHTCAFSDHRWPQGVGLFPTACEVHDYLESYAERFHLRRYTRLGHRVTQITHAQGQKHEGSSLPDSSEDSQIPPPLWRVCYSTPGGEIEEEYFQRCIVASGVFGVPEVPRSVNVQDFLGETIHCADYDGPDRFAGKRVLVVGAAFSGADIASEISVEAASCISSAGSPMWVLPRTVKSEGSSSSLPLDMLLYSRKRTESTKGLSPKERNLAMNKLLESLSPPDCKGLVPCPAPDSLPQVTVSDLYLPAVASGQLKIKPRLASLSGSTARFSDSSTLEVDSVVFCTGFRSDLQRFISKDILAAVAYNDADLLMPLALHNFTLHPDLPGMAFVGLYRGPYFAAMELQARWAARIWTRQTLPPSDQALREGVKAALRTRESVPRPQFPSSYVPMCDALARAAGVMPEGTAASADISGWLWSGPLLPAHFRLGQSEPAEVRASAEAYIR